MPPYSQIHAEYLVYILLGGVLFVGLLWLAIQSKEYTFGFGHGSQEEPAQDIHEFGGEVQEGHGPMPLFLVVMLVLFVAWAIGYTLYSVDNFPY